MPAPSTLMSELVWKQYLSLPSLQSSILRKFEFAAHLPETFINKSNTGGA